MQRTVIRPGWRLGPSTATLASLRGRHFSSTTPKPWSTSPATCASSGIGGGQDNKKYSHTLLLPKTPFPAKGDEAKWREAATGELWRWQKEQTDKPTFVLHDGPPYANGHLHMGHALNKILKDIVLRYKILTGHRVDYVPGFDCHGLPIELKALASLSTPSPPPSTAPCAAAPPPSRPSQASVRHNAATPGGATEAAAPSTRKLTPEAIRKAARQTAEEGVRLQKQEFREFAVLGDWDKAWTTMDPEYEHRQLTIFASLLSRRLIHRRHKPVLFSPSSGTALAEAEVEYRDHHESRSVYASFPVLPPASPKAPTSKVHEVLGQGQEVGLAIWTTTPWTLPANQAVAVNPSKEYSIISLTQEPDDSSIAPLPPANRLLIVASERVEAFSSLFPPSSVSVVARVPGSDLLGLRYATPFSSPVGGGLPVLAAHYVTTDSGTGLVHTAPSHGAEDFALYRSAYGDGAGLLDFVDGAGRFRFPGEPHPPQDATKAWRERLLGKDVLGAGAKECTRIVKESGALLKEVTVRHRYPYDWRTKKPVITKATSQWFADLEPLKPLALSALDRVDFLPASGRNRLETFIKGRSEWCISRQRAWGVPIPILFSRSRVTASAGPASEWEPVVDADVVSHVVRVLQEKGTDHWWDGPVADFLPPSLLGSAESTEYRKGTDTMDVWFDSGCSWATLPSREGGTRPRADIVLEGSDQHRGWFQSLLLTAVAAESTGSTTEATAPPPRDNPTAPYAQVVTHGFTLDTKGRKMSKSLGNVISPLSIIHGDAEAKLPAFGTDALRLWAASIDYTKDHPVGPALLSQTAEALQKIRITARFLLGNLADRDNAPGDLADLAKLDLLDRWMLHALHTFSGNLRNAYDALAFNQAVALITEFTSGPLSGLYFNLSKDVLYNDAPDSTRRGTVVAILYQILRVYHAALAPIAPHMAAEIRAALPRSAEGFRTWPSLSAEWKDASIADKMAELLALREPVYAKLEALRQKKDVSSFAEAELVINASQVLTTPAAELLNTHADLLPRLFNISDAAVCLSQRAFDTVVNLAAPAWREVVEWRPIAGADAKFEVYILPAWRLKCPRCWQFTREDSKDTCDRCAEVLAQPAARSESV